jgi:hypothetical protein
MLNMGIQNIQADLGLLWIDNHGDSIPFLLQHIRLQCGRTGADLRTPVCCTRFPSSGVR